MNVPLEVLVGVLVLLESKDILRVRQVRLYYLSHGRPEDSRLHRLVFGNALRTNQAAFTLTIGPRLVLPRHLHMVHHLEYRLLYWSIICIGLINLYSLY